MVLLFFAVDDHASTAVAAMPLSVRRRRAVALATNPLDVRVPMRF
jgi:hypothetical protein